MIQRIQTLYLFGAAIVSTLGAFILPLYATEAEVFKATAGMYTFLTFGTGMSLFSGAVLLYKNRKLQLAVVRLGMPQCTCYVGLRYSSHSCYGGRSSQLGCRSTFRLYCIRLLSFKRHTKG